MWTTSQLKAHPNKMKKKIFTEFVFSGSHDTKIRIWDGNTFECKCELEGHDFTIWSLLIHSNGKLYSGSADGSLREWNVCTANGGAFGPSRVLFRMPSDMKIYCLAAYGSSILSSHYKVINITDIRDATVATTIQAHNDSIWSIKVKDHFLYSCSDDQTLKVNLSR